MLILDEYYGTLTSSLIVLIKCQFYLIKPVFYIRSYLPQCIPLFLV